MSCRELTVAAVLLLGAGLAGPASSLEEPFAGQGEPATAVGTLEGRVTDTSGAGIAAVEIWIPELGRMTLSGSDGQYRIAGLPPGHYTAALRRVGYEPAARAVDVAGVTTLDAALAISPFSLEPVLVTATPTPIQPEQSALPTATLGGEDLRKNQTVSLAHAIEQLPGVHTLSTGAQVGKPVIRGLTGPRVLVLDDSRRLEDYSWSDEDGPSIDARLTDRVEVIRGPASVLYGSDALGGVVNAVPRPLPEAPPGSSVLRGGFEVYGASNNREGGSALRLEGAQGGFGWRAFVVGRASSDLHTPEGALQNTGFLALNGEGVVGLRGRAGNLTLRYARYGGEFKLLEAEGQPTGGQEEEGPERKLSDDRVQLGASRQMGSIGLEARAQWQRHNLIEVADDPNAPPGSKTESEQFNLLLNTGTLELLANHQHGRLRSTIGVSGTAQANDTRGPIPLVPDAHVSSGAVFAYERVALGDWSLLAAVRGDFLHIDADANSTLNLSDQSRHDTPFSADVGFVYAPVRGLSIAANFGQAWRSPTLFELYANGPHLGELRYEIGNPGLEPERGLDLDGSVRWESRRVVGEIAGFCNTLRDFIFITPTDDFRDSLRVYRHEQSDATVAGGEFGLQVEAHRNLTLQGRFDYVWGQNVEIDEPLPLIPPARGVVGGRLHWSDLGWASKAAVGAEVEFVAEQTRLSAFDTPTSSYALVHLEAGFGQSWAGRPVQIDLAVRNVGDVSYRDYLSRYKEFALDQGRSVLIRVSTGL